MKMRINKLHNLLLAGSILLAGSALLVGCNATQNQPTTDRGHTVPATSSSNESTSPTGTSSQDANLRELTEEEVFENVEVLVSYYHPALSATANRTEANNITRWIKLEVISGWPADPNNIVVEATMGEDDARKLGIKPIHMTKKYVVEKYPRHITSLTEVDAGNMEIFKKHAIGLVTNFLEEQKEKNPYDVFPRTNIEEQKAKRNFEEPKITKAYFLTAKPDKKPNMMFGSSRNGAYNQTIFVLESKIYHHEAENGITMYFPVRIHSLTQDADGKLEYDLENLVLDHTSRTEDEKTIKEMYVDRYLENYDLEELVP